jgi:hypothetical protein
VPAAAATVLPANQRGSQVLEYVVASVRFAAVAGSKVDFFDLFHRLLSIDGKPCPGRRWLLDVRLFLP